MQRAAHLPAVRFDRILRFLEQDNQVTHEDHPSTGGRCRRLLFPSTQCPGTGVYRSRGRGCPRMTEQVR
jgi:hypothetical protein